MTVLPDGRVVTGGTRRVLVWDPALPGAGPVELGRHDRHGVGGGGAAGRAGGHRRQRRVLVWDPALPGAGPVELGRDVGAVGAVAVLPDGRVVSGGYGGRVLVWDPALPGAGPVELGRHHGGVRAVAVLPDGRVVSGGYYDDRVRLQNVQGSSPGTLLACSAYALATFPSPSGARLFIGHPLGGISCWEVRPATQDTQGASAK